MISMRKGEVWLIYLDPTVGAEIKKTRPPVIVSEDTVGILPLRIIVPITDWRERYAVAPWMVHINPDSANNLNKPLTTDAFQIRPISTARFVKRIGMISIQQLQEIIKAIQTVIGA